MPPVASNNNPVSDSEDEDYVPPAHEQESDESSNEHEEVVSAPPKLVEGDPEERKRKRATLWADFQASISNAKVPETQPNAVRVVKIEKKYRFAGDEVVEVVEVPEDSPEAKKWPLWKDPNSGSNPTSQHARTCNSMNSLEPQTEANANEGTLCADSTTNLQNQSESASSVVPKPGKRPGPRKPKTTLAPVPTFKPKKITTLDKSAMDWREHIKSEQEVGSSFKDELEAHRKAGGYLEKMEFLKRVEERKEENLDIVKSSKRRKL